MINTHYYKVTLKKVCSHITYGLVQLHRQILTSVLFNPGIVSSGNVNHVNRHFKFHDRNHNSKVTGGQSEVKVITEALSFVLRKKSRMMSIF